MPIVLFILNPGSTSTKTALFRDTECLFEQTVRHSSAELQQAGSLAGQLPIRLAAIETALAQALAANHLAAEDIAAFVGRGGLTRSVSSGTYRVNADMLADLQIARYGVHASNLGAIIADELAGRYGKQAYIVDPPSVDEMTDLARYTGLPIFRRKSAFHALNQKATARMAAREIGRSYYDCNLIVAHLGGGISVGAHQAGRVIDVNNALEEGPFSPERAGTLPTMQLVDFVFIDRYNHWLIQKMLVGRGGLCAYTGTTDCLAIERQMEERPDYKELLQAMTYQIAKEIGAMAASLSGRVDSIILTGGLAHSAWLTAQIAGRVSFIAPVRIYPGDYELAALAGGARRVLTGEEEALEYVREPIDEIYPEPAIYSI